MALDAPVNAVPLRGRILLVEAHHLAGETLQAALAGHGFDVALSACTSGAKILEEAQAYRPSVVVLELELAGAGSGRALIRPLVDLGGAVVVLTEITDRLELALCLEAGAVGVVSHAESFASASDKFRRAANGETVTPLGDRARYQTELDAHRRTGRRRLAPFESLSPRERDVLAKIVDGRSAADIARRSYVSVPTIRTQIRSILLKLDVQSQMAAAAMARQAGWSPPAENEETGQMVAIR
jgi:two-component system, NarL family, nitrate/nitrite response regulator NarL